jgi:hypothetical protein
MAEGQSNSEQNKEIEDKINVNKIALKILKDKKKIQSDVKSSVENYSSNGDGLEKNLKEKIDNYSSEQFKNKKKQFKSQGKSQLNSLVSILKTSMFGTGNTSTEQFVTDIFIKAANNSKGRIKNILTTETISALGCAQEQSYIPRDIYISVSSLDIFGKTLTNSPNSVPGKYLYENQSFSPVSIPRAFNRELYNRIQNQGVSYSQEYGINYLGVTNQPLFDITYVTKSGQTSGFFYKVDLQQRYTGYKVVDFLGDYLDSIDVVNIKEIYKNVLDLLTGSVSFSLKMGDDSLRDQTKFEKILQRILGLCFDNKTEIDVSGVGKLDQLDQVDDQIFTMDEIDNLEIENKIKNLLSGVVEFQDCGQVQLPISSPTILNLLDGFDSPNLTTKDYDFLAKNMLDTLSQNPEWKIKLPNIPNLSDIINLEFIKLIPIAIINSLLSPKHLFPLYVMSKSLGNSLSDDIETLEDFSRIYKKYLIQVSSKISSIFIEELVKEIKTQVKDLIESIINQQLLELVNKKNKTIQSVLLLINAGLNAAALISDYRRCKSIIDELQNLLQVGIRLASLSGAQIPPVINYLAFAKPGMTPTSILKRYVQKLEESGIPTGDLPDGSPNLGLVAQQAFNEALLDEIAENGKVSVAISTKEVAGALYGPNPIINLSGNLE